MAVADLAHAVTAFDEGARLHAIGSLLSNDDVIDAGMGKIKEALAVIDAESESGRDILIPFLAHADAMARCEAARALHPTRRELATPILHDLHLSCVNEANFVARWFLVFAGEPSYRGDALTSVCPTNMTTSSLAKPWSVSIGAEDRLGTAFLRRTIRARVGCSAESRRTSGVVDF